MNMNVAERLMLMLSDIQEKMIDIILYEWVSVKKDDIKIPSPVVHFILIRRESVSCII